MGKHGTLSTLPTALLCLVCHLLAVHTTNAEVIALSQTVSGTLSTNASAYVTPHLSRTPFFFYVDRSEAFSISTASAISRGCQSV